MINTIDQHLRKKMGISSVHYLVMDVCSQYKNLLRPTNAKDIASETGLTDRTVSTAMNDLCKTSPRLLEEHENGSLYPTRHWYESIIGEAVTVSTEANEISKKVIEFFNEVNQSKFLIPNNVELVKNILKVYPRLTLEHFKSVILHKRETWWADEGMKIYNRPSTIFRNAQRFLRYLDEANVYWTNKAKQDEYSRTN